MSYFSSSTCLKDEATTDVKELRLVCPRAHKTHVDSSVAFLLISLFLTFPLHTSVANAQFLPDHRMSISPL